ncbi:MAG: M48 family metallopeptidase [Alphaproteobacteria bacterium]|nr:M48 family metallopeptidase [Alphaproteobacteria bacterium]NCQ88435.1 M48 family metallopeptidase [Alphaproteobacteria bacterium]NCT05978.1 M48 family metallopeptidase [Alphaproteobacteria bacterium]
MAIRATGLQTHIWNNNAKSILLLAFYPFLIIGIIWACALSIAIFTAHNSDVSQANAMANNIIYQYWPMIIAGIGIWFSIAYLFHTKMVRSMANSHPVTRKDEPELYNLLENLCISAGIAMPRLEIIESHARNAFASGIDQKSFCVTVTRGLMQSLSKDELEGVLAHELTHIINRDVRLLIITIIFTGMIGFAAQVMWRNVRYALWVPKRSAGNKKGGGIIILIAILVILWIGYFATLFTRFALSRRREYMADAGAVQITKNPDAMIRALMRIAGKDQIPKIPADISMMCFENHVPFMGLFATHPPIETRIRALSQTTGTPIPDLPALEGFKAPVNSPKNSLSAPSAPKDKQFSPWDRPRTNWTTRERFKTRRTQNPWH